MEESKKLRSTATSAIHTPSNSSPASRTGKKCHEKISTSKMQGSCV